MIKIKMYPSLLHLGQYNNCINKNIFLNNTKMYESNEVNQSNNVDFS